MKKLQIALMTVLTVASVGVAALLPLQQAAAACADPNSCASEGLNAAGGTSSTNINSGTIIKTIVNILLYVLGAVSVIMIVLGGFRYVISQGDSSKITTAKNTILYAVIGLVVALLAYAIVNFVIQHIK